MSIDVQCSGCGKSYTVESQFIGRRVRCKHCGETFLISDPAPAQAPAEESDPFTSMAAIEDAADSMPVDVESSSGRGAGPLSYAQASRGAKPKPRTGVQGPSALTEFIDGWLPKLLVLIFYVPIALLSFRNAFNAPYPAVSIFLSVVGIVLLIWVVLPLAALGLHIAGNAMQFRLREDPRLKILAAFCPVPAAMIVAVLAVVSTSALIAGRLPQGRAAVDLLLHGVAVGLVWGILVSFFLLWLLFHLRFLQALVSWVMTSIFYVMGVGAAGFILFLLMFPIGWIIHSAGWKPSLASQNAAARNADLSSSGSDKSSSSNGSQPDSAASQELAEKQRGTERNLREIYIALRRYRSTHPAILAPATLGELVSLGLLAPQSVNSPFDSSAGAPYEYHGEVPSDMPGTVWIAYDNGELASSNSTHVLLSNGEVRTASVQDLTQLKLIANDHRITWERNRLEQQKAAQALAAQNAAVVQPEKPTPVVPKIVKPPTFLDRFGQDKSELVSGITPLDAGAKVRAFVHPAAASPFLGVVKDGEPGQVTVEIWNAGSGQKIADTSFAEEAAKPRAFALNATGTYLAHIARWPKLSLRIWSIKDQKETRTIALNERFGTPAVAGFLTGDKVAVRWTRGLDEGLEIWDANTGQHGKQIPLDRHQASANNGVLSADGRLFALTTHQTRNNRPQLEIYDLLSATGGYRWLPLADLDATVADAPTGMAFSPDGKKLAAVFSHNIDAIIFCWRTTDGKLLGQYSIVLSKPPKPAHDAGRGLDWIDDGKAWLIAGDTLVDADTGRPLGRLNAPPVKGQWTLDPTTLLLEYETESNKPAMATVALDLAKAHAATAPAQ